LVRNLDSGEVEAVFEGEEDKVKEMIEWCKKGPDSALVKEVKVKFENYTGEFESFETD
jgi:acylphosphatase